MERERDDLMPEVEDKGKSLSKDVKASIYDFAILEIMKVRNLEIVDRKDIDKILSEQEF